MAASSSAGNPAGPSLAAVAGFALLVALAFADPLLTSRSFTGRDLLPYGFPIEKATHDAWARGRLPVWNESVSGGRPQMANPNTGVLYPLRPLLAAVPFPTAMRLMPVAHWFLAGWGMLALLGALGASRAAGWVAAGTYAFSGVLVSHVFYLPLQPGAALQPWALWALVRPAAGAPRRALGIALVYGLLLLAGDVLSVLVALAAAALWIGLEVSGGARRSAVLALLGGVGLGALLAAPQLAATAGLVPLTRRAVTGMPLWETLKFSLQPWRLLELVVPFPFGETWTMDPSRNWAAGWSRGFFVTLFCGAFAVLCVPFSRRVRGTRFCLALGAGAFVLATVGILVPASAGGLASPLPLRYPEKLLVGATLALALHAGLAVDALGARSAGRLARTALVVAGALALGAVAARLALRGGAADQLPPALAEGGLLWAATAGAVAALGSGSRGARRGAAAVLAVLPLVATRRIALTDRDAALLPPTAFARAVARRDPAARFRAVDASPYRAPSRLEHAEGSATADGVERARRSWFFLTPSLWNRQTVFNSDLDAGDLSRVESLRRVSSYAATDASGAALFSSASLRFAIRYRDQPPLPGFARFGGSGPQDWDENPDAEPDVRLVRRWREAPDAVAALGTLPSLAGDEVVLETGGRAAGASPAGSVRVVTRTPERLELDVVAPAAGWLFVLRGFWPFRDVRVDGAPVEPVPAQLAFSAIPVPAGTHRVVWRERVAGERFAWAGPALFVLGAAVLLRPRAAGA